MVGCRNSLALTSSEDKKLLDSLASKALLFHRPNSGLDIIINMQKTFCIYPDMECKRRLRTCLE